MTRKTALDIAVAGSTAAPASPEHKRFKTLLDKIDKARLRLQTWQEQLPLFAQMHAERVAPLQAAFSQQQRAWAFELEQRLLQGRWTRGETRMLDNRIETLTVALLAQTPDDAELKALHDRHAELDHDAQQQQQVDAMRALFEAEGDVDLGSEPIRSIAELLQRAQAANERALQERENNPVYRETMEKAAQARERAERKAQHKAEHQPQSASARRAAAEQQQASQTVREVYRKLASALHPDRIDAEATPEQRRLQTERMAAANAAYAAGDLLALLTLQLQIEQVDVARAAGLAAAQLKHVNKLLAEQLRELEAESDERQAALAESYDFVIDKRLDPAHLGRVIQEEIRFIETQRAQIELERRKLTGEPAQAKRWLKQLLELHRQRERLDPDW